jgi:hypothetical protein
MRESTRRMCLIAVVALLSFGPGAFAHARVASPVSASSFSSSVGTFVFSPQRDDWDWNKKKRKKVAASEGGNAALYLMFAGLACGTAVLFRSRQTSAAKSA